MDFVPVAFLLFSLPVLCCLFFSFPCCLFYAFSVSSSAEALVLRSGVLTRKSMYIDGIFLYLFLSDRAVLFFSFFFRYVAMQFLARTGFHILTVNRP